MCRRIGRGMEFSQLLLLKKILQQQVYSKIIAFYKSRKSALVNSFIEQFRIVVQDMNEEMASLSGGNQQKVVLAKYLACNPKVIILDEPTRGIDAKARLEVYETIRKMKREGLAILLISSDVEEIVQLVNRVYVMRNGRFVSHMEKNN